MAAIEDKNMIMPFTREPPARMLMTRATIRTLPMIVPVTVNSKDISRLARGW
jgi:hypothetical protein